MKRPKKRARPRPTFTIDKVLAWADDYHRRTGQWPHRYSGAIPGTDNDNWRRVDSALVYGLRGLRGGTSLARLLEERRGVRNVRHLPELTEDQIANWAQTHFLAHGTWPNENSGAVADTKGEDWRNIDMALRDGGRGLPGGDSLAKLLGRVLDARTKANLPPLTEDTILDWADAHRERTGKWPAVRSGPIPESPGDEWVTIEAALAKGSRGLPGGSSLARLLAKRRGARNPSSLPPLTAKAILAWADAHFKRTGRWPTATSGPVEGVPGETWGAVQRALYWGLRGLAGGDSLYRFLKRHCKRS